MEKKEILSGLSTLRALFSLGAISKPFLGRFNNRRGRKTSGFLNSLHGFTLVELLVVIMMLAAMFSLAIVLLNPLKQIEKARDSQRQSDVRQANQALDTYYNDKNCYPPANPNLAGQLGFGSNWAPYTQMLPQDPTYLNNGYGYVYVTDSSNCPQWNVIFAKLNAKLASTSECPLEQMISCLPINYASAGYNYCVLSGKVDCSTIKNFSFNIPAQYIPPTSGPTSIPTPTSAALPTNTPTPTNVPPTSTPTPPAATPTLMPGGCYCSTCNDYSIQCYAFRPSCNIVGKNQPPPGNFCDLNCTISCQ